MAGVSGNGQQELLAALSGEDRRAAPQSIQLFGKPIARQPPRTRRAAGLRFVPEERLGRGAVATLSLAKNTLLTRDEAVGPGGWIRSSQLVALARRLLERFHVKAGGPDAAAHYVLPVITLGAFLVAVAQIPMGGITIALDLHPLAVMTHGGPQAAAQSLSGGNLQRFLVGREIDARPRLLIVSQPTWGVDVGAAAQIRAELLALRDGGCALLVVSEELDELFEISDRLIVMARGSVSPSLPTSRATKETIGAWMSGLWTGTPPGAAHDRA